MAEAKHPAKYTDSLIPVMADKLIGKRNVIDIFAGTCKISDIKEFGFTGEIYCNEIEPEWASIGLGKVDNITTSDAEFLPFKDGFFSAICTSPTYGNRMADSHNAKDGSVRNTYTHKLGRKLSEGNTGKMQWGDSYRDKHMRIWAEAYRVLEDGGTLVLNISDHIRMGEVIPVTNWHTQTIIQTGFEVVDVIEVKTPRMRFGANSDKRVGYESVIEFRKV